MAAPLVTTEWLRNELEKESTKQRKNLVVLLDTTWFPPMDVHGHAMDGHGHELYLKYIIIVCFFFRKYLINNLTQYI